MCTSSISGRTAYKTIRIAPAVGGGLTEATTTYQSVRGKIQTHWKLDNDILLLSVEIPANTTAHIMLPTTDQSIVLESGRPITHRPHELGSEVHVGFGS